MELKTMKTLFMTSLLALSVMGCGQQPKAATEETAEEVACVSSDRWQIGSEINWEPAGEGVTRQIMGYDNNLMIVKVSFETGGIGTAHQHPHSQATYVVSGKFELDIAGEKKILEAGDGYYVAPNEIHGCICLEAGVLIDTFSPYREDFIK